MSVQEVDTQGGYNLLQSYSSGVLDVRSAEVYAQCHVFEAHNFETADWGSLRMREEILVYGTSLAHVEASSAEVLARLRGVRSKFRALFLLATPFEDFAAKFSFLCGVCPQSFTEPTSKRQVSRVREKRPRYPSEIVEGCLYHGHKLDASRPEVIHNLKITHIVNATRTTPCFFEGKESEIPGLVYLRLVLDDCDDDDLTEALDRGPAFIQEAARSGGKVLVHCQEGLSRSSAVVLAFLLRSSDRTLAEAVVYLGRCRPIIQPNEGYMDQLALFELKLHPDLPSSRMNVPSKYVRPRPVGRTPLVVLPEATEQSNASVVEES